MAGENLIGGDAVLNYGTLRQDYYKNQATQASIAQQERKAQEATAKQAADVVAKINPNGLRDADIPEFSAKYDTFRDIAMKVAGASSIGERAKLNSELQNAATDLQLFINSSKSTAGLLKEKGTLLSSNPYRTNNSQLTLLTNYNKTPTSKLQGVDFNNDFRLGARASVWSDIVKNAGNDIQKEASQQPSKVRDLGYIRENGKVIKRYQDVATLPAQDFINKLSNAYNTNPEAKDYVDEQSKILGITPQEFITRNVETNKDKLTWSSNQKVDLTPPKASGGGTPDDSDAILRNHVVNYGGKGKGTTTLKRTVQLSEPKRVTNGVFNLTDLEGNIIKGVDPVTSDMRVASIDETPIARVGFTDKRTGKTYKKGSVLTTDFADKNKNMVDYELKASIIAETPINPAKPSEGKLRQRFYANPNDVISESSLSKNKRKAYNQLIKEHNDDKKNSSQSSNNTGKKKLSW